MNNQDVEHSMTAVSYNICAPVNPPCYLWDHLEVGLHCILYTDAWFQWFCWWLFPEDWLVS